jgi:hypothetical protein
MSINDKNFPAGIGANKSPSDSHGDFTGIETPDTLCILSEAITLLRNSPSKNFKS